MNTSEKLSPQMARLKFPALAIGVICYLIWLAGACMSSPQSEAAYRCYLAAYLFVLGLALGSLAFVMLHRLVGGDWGLLIRRSAESASTTLPLLAVLLLPILLKRSIIYPWSHGDWVEHDPIMKARIAYFRIDFYMLRYVLYFVIWSALAFTLSRGSLAYDRTEDPKITRRLMRVSAFGVMIYILTMTFASYDWVMSIDAHWYSSIIGFIFVIGQALTALTFLILVLRMLANRPPFTATIQPGPLNDLGNLVFTLIILWAYTGFAQFLISWMGNTTNDALFYNSRMHGGLGALGMFLIACHFFLPFILLLLRPLKRRINILARIAAWVLVLRMIDLFYWILPMGSTHPEYYVRFGYRHLWVAPFAVLGLGGIWLWYFLVQLGGKPLLPLLPPEEPEIEHGTEGHRRPGIA